MPPITEELHERNENKKVAKEKPNKNDWISPFAADRWATVSNEIF